MNIEWATLCKRSELDAEGVNIFGANLEFAVAPELPVQVSCMIAVKLGGITNPPEVERVTVRIVSPEGVVLHEETKDVVVELPDGIEMPEGVSVHHPMIGNLAWGAESYGAYTIVTESGDGTSYEVKLTVISGF